MVWWDCSHSPLNDWFNSPAVLQSATWGTDKQRRHVSGPPDFSVKPDALWMSAGSQKHIGGCWRKHDNSRRNPTLSSDKCLRQGLHFESSKIWKTERDLTWFVGLQNWDYLVKCSIAKILCKSRTDLLRLKRVLCGFMTLFYKILCFSIQ